MQKPVESIQMKNRQSLCGKGEGVIAILGWVSTQMRIANRGPGGGRNGVFEIDFRPIHKYPASDNQNATYCSSVPYIVDGGRGVQESVQLYWERKSRARTWACDIVRIWARICASERGDLRVCNNSTTHPQTFQP